ncbi:hypothetical protein OIU85_021291 [Salix viminalis]|uniref:Uncharacterized protein n=1 Tax=Salix viminalis TaxID=40686 RepID=A0A9Q0UID0_SALVM|nr:hypothetical protein OIU85_021291 [Salix viminalis]
MRVPVVDSSCNKSSRPASSLMQVMSLLEKMKLMFVFYVGGARAYNGAKLVEEIAMDVTHPGPANFLVLRFLEDLKSYRRGTNNSDVIPIG